MEDYLQNLRCLRSQMNEIEEAAAKRSVEEMNLKTSIEAFEKDLLSVRSEITHLNAEFGEMERERAQICCKILEKQKKISAVEIETSTLLQSKELITQETVSASARLEEKRLYYTKIMEELVSKLQQGHEWLDSYKQHMATVEPLSKQIITQLEQKHETFPPVLKALDVRALEELKAVLADKTGEMEYMKLLEDQIKQIKSVSHVVKCQCGEEFNVWPID